jgi:hypothetical protein
MLYAGNPGLVGGLVEFLSLSFSLSLSLSFYLSLFFSLYHLHFRPVPRHIIGRETLDHNTGQELLVSSFLPSTFVVFERSYITDEKAENIKY